MSWTNSADQAIACAGIDGACLASCRVPLRSDVRHRADRLHRWTGLPKSGHAGSTHAVGVGWRKRAQPDSRAPGRHSLVEEFPGFSIVVACRKAGGPKPGPRDGGGTRDSERGAAPGRSLSGTAAYRRAIINYL